MIRGKAWLQQLDAPRSLANEVTGAVTHAAAHAPARPGITEALGTTDSHTFELGNKEYRSKAGKGHKAQDWTGIVGRDYSEQYLMT